MESRATRRDYEEFLLFLYFGPDCLANPQQACARRAYLDFNRTIHGLGNFPAKSELYHKAENSLIEAISNLTSRTAAIDQDKFDQWHQRVCMSLKATYSDSGFVNFSIGQAQKWVNMTFKYIYTFGEAKIPGFAILYKYCHVPLDNIIINKLVCHGFSKLMQAWSRIDNYAEYLECQKWIRQRFAMLPLDLELFAWMKADFDLAQHLKSPSATNAFD